MQPIPFEIARPDNGPKVASNGSLRLSVLEPEGEIRLRRAIAGLSPRPAGELVLPKLNALAGELLADLAMPPEQLIARLTGLIGLVPTSKPRNVEWAMAELDGVKVYTDGVDVIVTRQDLRP